MRFNESLKYIQRQAFYAEHQLLAVWMILIALILPFLGLVVSGLFGVIAGALVSFAAFYLMPYVWLKVGVCEEEEKGTSYFWNIKPQPMVLAGSVVRLAWGRQNLLQGQP